MMLRIPVHIDNISKATTTGAATIVDKRPTPATPNAIETAIKNRVRIINPCHDSVILFRKSSSADSFHLLSSFESR